MLAFSKGLDPFLLAHYDKSNPQAHASELTLLQSKLSMKVSQHPHELQELFKQVLLAPSPAARGNLGTVVSRPWFQDPLLKTIRYLENLEFKEMQQKVQFLNGLQKVLDKFETKLLIEKVMPHLMRAINREPQLCVHILPIVID